MSVYDKKSINYVDRRGHNDKENRNDEKDAYWIRK